MLILTKKDWFHHNNEMFKILRGKWLQLIITRKNNTKRFRIEDSCFTSIFVICDKLLTHHPSIYNNVHRYIKDLCRTSLSLELVFITVSKHWEVVFTLCNPLLELAHFFSKIWKSSDRENRFHVSRQLHFEFI